MLIVTHLPLTLIVSGGRGIWLGNRFCNQLGHQLRCNCTPEAAHSCARLLRSRSCFGLGRPAALFLPAASQLPVALPQHHGSSILFCNHDGGDSLSSVNSKRKQKQAYIIKAAQLYEQAAAMVHPWDREDEAGGAPGKVSPPAWVPVALQAKTPSTKCEKEDSDEESDSEPAGASDSGLASAVRIPPAPVRLSDAAHREHVEHFCQAISGPASSAVGNEEGASEPALAAETPGGASSPVDEAIIDVSHRFVTPRPRVLFRRSKKHRDGSTTILEQYHHSESIPRERSRSRDHSRREYFDREHTCRSHRRAETSHSRGRSPVRSRRHHRSRSRSRHQEAVRVNRSSRKSVASPCSSASESIYYGDGRDDVRVSDKSPEHHDDGTDSPPAGQPHRDTVPETDKLQRGCRA